MKNVKPLIIIITIIVIAIILFASVKILNKPEYSLQDIRDVINTDNILAYRKTRRIM